VKPFSYAPCKRWRIRREAAQLGGMRGGADAPAADAAKAARTVLSTKTPQLKRLALIDASLDQQTVSFFNLDHGEDIH